MRIKADIDWKNPNYLIDDPLTQIYEVSDSFITTIRYLNQWLEIELSNGVVCRYRDIKSSEINKVTLASQQVWQRYNLENQWVFDELSDLLDELHYAQILERVGLSQELAIRTLCMVDKFDAWLTALLDKVQIAQDDSSSALASGKNSAVITNELREALLELGIDQTIVKNIGAAITEVETYFTEMRTNWLMEAVSAVQELEIEADIINQWGNDNITGVSDSIIFD